jgi:hypothetical protein
MRDNFDFEHQIMQCWGVIDEIKTLNKLVLEGKVEGGQMTTDEISNYLLGIQSIYEHKFEQLWNDFETVFMNLTRENKILREELVDTTKKLIATGE